MLIRPATTADANAITDVQIGGWRWAYTGLVPQDFLDSLDMEARAETWRQRIAEGQYNGPKYLFVAEEKDKVLGVASIGAARYEDRGQDGELWMLYVHPQAARTGVGKALFDHACDKLRQEGYSGFYVMCMRDNPIGRGFYEKMGGRLHEKLFTIDFAGVTLPDTCYIWRF